MSTITRLLEIALGLFFLASAGMKAMNIEGFGVQISAYGILKDPSLVNLGAYSVLAAETGIGAMFLAGRTLKGAAHAAAAALTVIFTIAIVYAWQVKGLEDCGCFGDYIQMGPRSSIFKNFVLLGILAAAWYFGRPKETDPHVAIPAWRPLLAAVGILAVIGIGVTQNQSSVSKLPGASVAAPTGSNSAGPFSKYVFATDSGTVDLGRGEYLAALLSATCEHCMNSVPALNEMDAAEDLPPVVGLMLGEESDIRDFRVLTEATFPLFKIPSLEFMQYIDTAPPKLIHLRDGVAGESWEWLEDGPHAQEVREALTGGS